LPIETDRIKCNDAAFVFVIVVAVVNDEWSGPPRYWGQFVNPVDAPAVGEVTINVPAAPRRPSTRSN